MTDDPAHELYGAWHSSVDNYTRVSSSSSRSSSNVV